MTPPPDRAPRDGPVGPWPREQPAGGPERQPFPGLDLVQDPRAGIDDRDGIGHGFTSSQGLRLDEPWPMEPGRGTCGSVDCAMWCDVVRCGAKTRPMPH